MPERPERPDFLNTAGQRSEGAAFADFDDAVEERYLRLAASRFVWSGLPEDMPEGWADICLYRYGGVGAKHSGLGDIVLPASPVKRNVYGRPLSWVPTAAYAVGRLDASVMAESDGPALWTGRTLHSQIRPWVEIIRDSMLSLQMNVCAMRSQTAIKGADSFDLNGQAALDSIKRGEPWVPLVNGQAPLIELMDLRPNDYTQALVNTIRAADAHILTLLGVMNSGTGRESGVTAMETDSVSQELQGTLDRELALRQEWAERVSAYLGTPVTVELADAFKTPEPMTPEQEDGDDGDGKDRDSE